MAVPTMSALVTALETRLGLPLGSLDGVDLNRAQAVLTDASALVTSELRGVVDPFPATALAVLMAAAKRAYLNPSDVQSETIGQYAVVWGAFGVGLLTTERSILMRSKAGSGLWTMGTTRGDLETSPLVFDQWADGTASGGDALPFENYEDYRLVLG